MSNPLATLRRLSKPPPPPLGTYTLSYGPIDHSTNIDIGDGVELSPKEERIIFEQSTQLTEKVKIAIEACGDCYNALRLITSCGMNSTNSFTYTVSFTLYHLE